jgi:hypothetical protein
VAVVFNRTRDADKLSFEFIAGGVDQGIAVASTSTKGKMQR